MTPERFKQLVDRCTVQNHYELVLVPPPCIVISGLSREELAEIVALAGRQLGVWPENADINPGRCKVGQDLISP